MISDKFTNSEIDILIANALKRAPDSKDGTGNKQVASSIFVVNKNRVYDGLAGDWSYV